MPDGAILAARTSAAMVRQSQRDAEERLASVWWRADLGATAEPRGAQAVPYADSRWWQRALATWMSHAGRPFIFIVAVAIIHLAVLRWIFLPIGG